MIAERENTATEHAYHHHHHHHEALLSRLEERPRRLVDAQLTLLKHEFDGRVSREHVIEASDEVLTELLEHARFTDFVPVLTYRYTKQLLAEAELEQAA